MTNQSIENKKKALIIVVATSNCYNWVSEILIVMNYVISIFFNAENNK